MGSIVQKRRVFLVAFLVAMTVCNMILAFRLIPKMRNGYQDFTIFYTGARLIRDGQAAVLYNLAAQYRMQQTFTNVPIRLGPLPFNHPPFEALFFVPFTFLSYWSAYLLWTGLNILMFGSTAILLKTRVPQFAAVSPVILGVGATAFFPTAIALIQGQDVILLLLLFVMAIICLDQRRDAVAGILLGLGLFRPQFVVPVVILLAVRRWRILIGFAPVAILLAGITVAVMGWSGPLDYGRFVLHLEGTQARAFGPEAVPNLRGLILQIPGLNAAGLPAHLLILASSITAFLLALRRIQKGRDSILFVSSLAAVTTILVGYHSLVYDLSFLLPMALLLLDRTVGIGGRSVEPSTVMAALLFFLTPLYLFLYLVTDSLYLFSLLLLWCLFSLLRTPAPAEVPA
jgi:glycosyl transferase family 87